MHRPSYGINAPAVPYSEFLPVYIRITDITEDSRFLPTERVSVRSELSDNYFLEDGDIVFARTGASVGKSYRYRLHDGPLVFAGFLIRVRPDTAKLLPSFVSAYVTTGAYWRWVRLTSMRSGQPGINGNEYAQLPIPLPPISEQRAIAAALSDVDGLLDGLDRLIAKKRDLKQAAMQELLTGETRLPGFQGGWEVKRLGDVAGLNRQSVTPASEPNQPFIHFSLPAFDNGKTAQVELGAVIRSNKFRVPSNAVLLSKLNPRIPRVWAPDHVPENACASTEWLVLTPGAGIERAFLFFLCSSPAFCRQMELAATGTTGSHQRTSPNTALDIRVALPVDQNEQTAIATVLSDMNAELAALEQRKEKTRDVMQAMMQELLTGSTRLPLAEERV
jgi:type I restriction enzyme S subunit